MARRPGTDARQEDFFGAPAPKPEPAAKPAPRPARPGRPAPPVPPPVPPSIPIEPPPEPEPIEAQIARLSGMELRALAASLTDEALAQLTLATIRQLRRRLERAARRPPGARATVLDRAAQQLMQELAEPGEEDGF